jgi:hypothetical protein
MPAIEQLDQREVGFRDRLEQPRFLEELPMLRMPHERQVSMENQGEITSHSRSLRERLGVPLN